MAGQARRGTRRPERSSRAASSWARSAVASAVASGSATAITTASSPEPSPDLHTRAIYRNLLLRGLAPAEAANLTKAQTLQQSSIAALAQANASPAAILKLLQ